MSLQSRDVEYIAHLARLAIDASEVPQYAQSLSSILDLVDSLNSVNTETIAPMSHPLAMAQRLRPDLVDANPGETGRDQFQAHAPQVSDGLYLVPRVVE
ncbi:MAG: Asp-tRNA(Asn)/Glu-tRNA(Gln) amidotransferase subunit GatC [Gammaproteobacteria bacterium]|nr:Asp-tRNA(Asn)/Glu-tRNA(Gln) amidotransferase subunit GatC [Gammaproteobacteria bacterium]